MRSLTIFTIAFLAFHTLLTNLFNFFLHVLGVSKSLPIGLPKAYYSGFKGCIKSIKIEGHELDFNSNSAKWSLKYCQ